MESAELLAAETLGDGRDASRLEARDTRVQLLDLEIAAVEHDRAEKPLLLRRELAAGRRYRLAARDQGRKELALHVHFAGAVLAALAVPAGYVADELGQHRDAGRDLVGVVGVPALALCAKGGLARLQERQGRIPRIDVAPVAPDERQGFLRGMPYMSPVARVFQSLKRSSSVTSDCTTSAFPLCLKPYVVTKVRCTDLRVPVSSLNSAMRSRSFLAYASPIENSSRENFISQRLITPSLRSIIMSICVPDDFLALRHEDISADTPAMPRAALMMS